MTKNDINSTFYAAFLGKNVFITTSVQQTHRIALGQGMETETLPMYFEGVLMDMDEKYLYLGDGKEVSNAIKESYILEIQAKEEEDEYTKILKAHGPKGETDFN